jgi:glycosyltransferase involved in cell wall biosynthesis
MSNFRGWILEAIPRESADAIDQEVTFSFIPTRRRELITFRATQNYFVPRTGRFNLFIHHRTFLFVDKKQKLQSSRNRIWLTHFDDNSEIELLVRRRRYIDTVFVQNSRLSKLLTASGFPVEKISIQPGAINRSTFSPSNDSGSHTDYFLFTGNCRPRKNPMYVKWLITSFPEINFVIHGSGWSLFDNGSLLSISNLTIIDFDFRLQPNLLRNASGLVIVSKNEGGPIALLESLACGTPVISTDTGFSADMLTGQNGRIVTLESDVADWATFFDEARQLKRASQGVDLLGKEYSWEQLGTRLYQ